MQNNGATPKTALTTRDFIRRNFAKGFTNEWPAQSPDLTPADFYLWPTLKSMMYTSKEPYESVSSLKRAVTYNMKQLSHKNMDHLVDSVKACWEWYIKVHCEMLHVNFNGQASLTHWCYWNVFLFIFDDCFYCLKLGQFQSNIQYIVDNASYQELFSEWKNIVPPAKVITLSNLRNTSNYILHANFNRNFLIIIFKIYLLLQFLRYTLET